jgi:membrane-bound metal-dependent hydrolase YbcI (DUF457 family)
VSHWAEHYMMDGVAGVLPDIPLVVSIILWRKKGIRVPITSNGYILHRATHSMVFFFVLCWAFYYWPRVHKLIGILMRHILLDYLTHDRNWLRYGYTKINRPQ